MRAYASATSGKRNIDTLRQYGWRMLLSPDSYAKNGRSAKGFPYAIDNGAWGCYQRGEPFAEAPFLSLVDEMADGADWVVVPDVVAGGKASLALSESWLPNLEGKAPLLLAVQDGIGTVDVAPLLGDVGIFLGGTTAWKLRTMELWGQLARERGCYFHVGRVNTVKRIFRCLHSGADSFDGSSASRWSVNVRRLDSARRQTALWGSK